MRGSKAKAGYEWNCTVPVPNKSNETQHVKNSTLSFKVYHRENDM